MAEAGPLPSVKQLQQEYGVGRDTVLRAIDILREEGRSSYRAQARHLHQPGHQVAGRKAAHAALGPATSPNYGRAQPSAAATPTGQDTPVPPRPHWCLGVFIA